MTQKPPTPAYDVSAAPSSSHPQPSAPAGRRLGAATPAATAIVAELRTLLPELELGTVPVTHEYLMRLLKERGVPASRRTYFAAVPDGSPIRKELERARERQSSLSVGGPVERLRRENAGLRDRIKALEDANRVLLLERAAMVDYLSRPPAAVSTEHLQAAQRHALDAAVEGTPFRRRRVRGGGPGPRPVPRTSWR